MRLTDTCVIECFDNKNDLGLLTVNLNREIRGLVVIVFNSRYPLGQSCGLRSALSLPG